jgi:hypothetical protein
MKVSTEIDNNFGDSEIKRNRSEVSSKWNKCRIYVISWTVAVGWSELEEVLDYG